MNDVRGRVLAGTFFHAPTRGTIDILEDALLAVDATGTIATMVCGGGNRATRPTPSRGM